MFDAQVKNAHSAAVKLKVNRSAVINQPVLLTLSLVLLPREDSLEKYRDHFSPSLTCRENELIKTNSSFGVWGWTL